MMNTSYMSHYLSHPRYLCFLLVALRGIRASSSLPSLQYLRADRFPQREGVRVEHIVLPRVRQALRCYEEADACDTKKVGTTRGYGKGRARLTYRFVAIMS
jgi:hypothetical protein